MKSVTKKNRALNASALPKRDGRYLFGDGEQLQVQLVDSFAF